VGSFKEISHHWHRRLTNDFSYDFSPFCRPGLQSALRSRLIFRWTWLLKEEIKKSRSTEAVMSGEFAELIARVRAGDPKAAEEMVRQYEPVIRMEIRRQMRDPRLRRAFDSLDVCQSVLGSFFVRASLGQYNLDDPAEVVRLLVGMARNKLAFQVRKEHRQCRDNRRVQPLGEHSVEPPAADPSPSQIVADEELLHVIRRALTEEERRLAERRALGKTWDAIAAELGGSPQARRKQLERAITRVVERFGLNEPTDD
jgi:RNA polymerase sigma factor (sigma-70 family)